MSSKRYVIVSKCCLLVALMFVNVIQKRINSAYNSVALSMPT